MAYWNRFDICEAYATLEWDYNVDGVLRERPSNKRRGESVSCQLARMEFRPSADLSSDSLNENAREIYEAAVRRLGFPLPWAFCDDCVGMGRIRREGATPAQDYWDECAGCNGLGGVRR